MTPVRKESPARGMTLAALIILNVIIIEKGFTDSEKWYYWLLISLPLAVFTAIRSPA